MAIVSFNFGDIVWVSIPFTDGSGSKDRPAVVVSQSSLNLQRADVVVLAITDASGHLHPDDLPIKDWQTTGGLSKPSVAKPLFTTLQKSLFRRKSGALSPADAAALREHLHTLLG